jgi:hypothetical protein
MKKILVAGALLTALCFLFTTCSTPTSEGAPDITGFTFTQTSGLKEGADNTKPGAAAGTLSAPKGGTGAITYSLTAGAGDTNNGSFTIEGAQLKIGKAALSEGSYSVRVRAADTKDKTFDKAVTITVLDALAPDPEEEEPAIPGAPPVPGAPAVTAKDDGFVISWNAVESAVSYEMLYSTGSARPGSASSGVVILGTSVEIADLEPNTNYYIWVRAINTIAKSNWSQTAAARTLNDAYLISSFTIGSSMGRISGTNISITLPHDADLAHLSPVFTLSSGASPDIASGTERDFSDFVNPPVYVITSENGKRVREYKIIVSLYGSGAFTFAFDDEGEAALPDDPVTIYKITGQATYVLTAAGGFDKYQWFVDGMEKTALGPTSTLTLNAADYTLGGHNLSVMVYRGSVPYSYELSFTVKDSE